MSLRLVTLGAGYFSQFQYRGWLRINDVQLVGICNRSRAKGEELARAYDIPAIFTDPAEALRALRPDFIDIITPPPTHLETIRLAAALKIDVICQKPFCRNLSEAREAVELAGNAGIRLLVHENFRFQPWYEKIGSTIKAGDLGEIYGATFRLRPGDGQGPSAYLDRQPYFREMPRFLIHETAIHLIDVFRCLFGEVGSVFAALRRLNPEIAGEDAGVVILEMAGGVQAVFDGNRLADHRASNRRLTLGELTIEGSGGVLMLDGDARLTLRAHGSNEERQLQFAWSDHDFGGDCVYRFQRHAVDVLLNRTSAQTLAADYLENLRIEEAIYESHRSGRKIELPSFDA
ncbi:Gfo/Idh/MocA family oxidoreductase [Bradyrhizobium sp.]|uniref:Gfo/Idh/MocA family protein n=1 Tax=Bradyrhizobium sp. TaxID=376 RepID=UPI000A530489|nr:Gfo/Idh/MocA family oxidoreductase [Bradyrhizobium sp.]